MSNYNSANYNPAIDVPPNRVMRRSLRHLGSDVVTLMELQAALLRVDLRDWVRACIGALVALFVGAVLALASLPLLLLSSAYALTEFTQLSMATSLLISAGAGLVLAIIGAAVGIYLLKRDIHILSRSSGELRRNVRWLKEVLTGPNSNAESAN